jgi:acyl-CoA thioesterase
VSQILPRSHTFINPDLTIYLHRYPRGEWVCIDAVTRVESNGIGLAESRLLDRDGTIGRSLQSLIVEERGP